MTDQHPLTDKTSDKLYEEFVDSNFSHWDETDYLVEDGYITTQNLMQIGADWQLECDAEWWRIILNRTKLLPPDAVNSIIEQFKTSMRPQEDNP